MDALTFFWLLGQALSLFGLAAGAVLVFLADEPFYGRPVDRPSCLPEQSGTARPADSKRRDK